MPFKFDICKYMNSERSHVVQNATRNNTIFVFRSFTRGHFKTKYIGNSLQRMWSKSCVQLKSLHNLIVDDDDDDDEVGQFILRRAIKGI